MALRIHARGRARCDDSRVRRARCLRPDLPPRRNRRSVVAKGAHTGHRGHVTDPDHVRRERDTNLIEKVLAVAAQRLPDLAPEVLSSQTCLYTSTPDEDFIIDHLPHAPAIWMVSGCSGHGFKFTVLLGHIAAQLATNDYHGRDLSRFALKRFALRH